MTTNTTRTGRLQAVVLDSARPAVLAEFYRDLLGGEITQSGDDQASLTVAGGALSFQRVPGGSVPGGGRLHLDVVVPDLDAARTAGV
jgi:catechol-2,3-dioxygenase